MHRRLLFEGLVIAGLAASLPVTVAAQTSAPALRAVASFSILADMVRQIGATHVTVKSLVGSDRDVHHYEPVPSDLRAVMSAAVLVENGMGLEGWIDRLEQATHFAGVRVIASSGVRPRQVGEAVGATATDPHAWQDPRNGMLYATAIGAGLAKADPANAADYESAAQRYARDIADTDAWIEAQFASVPSAGRRIITTHDAFGYYGARFGIQFLAAEGINPDAEPSARGIAALVAQIRRERIGTVFLENMTDPRIARMLTRESGARLGPPVFSDALSPPDGPAATYLAMLRYNTRQFVAALTA